LSEVLSPVDEWRLKQRDGPLITGKAKYVADIELPGMAFCAFLGSQCAHAKIKEIDVSKALKLPGVLTILTGKDLVELMNPLPALVDYRPLGWHWRIPKTYPLAVDKVRFFGEPLALVVAEDLYSAFDALSTIRVEYEPLPVVTDALEAMKPNAPLLYEDWGDNIQAHVKFNFGDVESAFREADKVLDVSWRERRCSGFPLEARGCVAYYDEVSGALRIWMSTQAPFTAATYISSALRMSVSDVKVVVPAVGGAFGNKLNYWKETAVALASIVVKRPVKWLETTDEFIRTGPHQRDVKWTGSVAIKNDGRVLGVKAKLIVDLGCEGTNRGSGAATLVPAACAVPNAYKLKGAEIDVYGVVTNKSFYCAYRGYGKDKGIKFMERIMDMVAKELRMRPEDVRFRNFIQPNEFPYHQISGYVYDSGDYPALLKKAIELADLTTWRREQERLRKEGRYIGIGVAFHVEPAGGAILYSVFSGLTEVQISITPEGKVEVCSNFTEIGQGSKIAITRIVSDILGVDARDIKIVEPSSDVTSAGPYSSRGAVYYASALAKAAKELRSRVIKIGSAILQEDEADIDIKGSVIYSVKDPSKRVTLKELARFAYYAPGPRGLPSDLQRKHETLLRVITSWFSPLTSQYKTSTYTTFCSTADVAIVEVDVETGAVKVLKYVHVHDAGKLIDEKVVEGQSFGGICQGLGEALLEELIYDEQGRLLSDSYADYVLPTALDMCDVVFDHLETPSPFTELGSKGMGESPIITSKMAIILAIEDALAPFGVVIDEAPATKERIYDRIIRSQRLKR
jgi:carbon-monoxide dehydrogenase large subunit